MMKQVVLVLADWDWTSPELPVQEWWFFGVVLVLLIIFITVVARLATTASEEIDPAEIDRQMLTAVNDLHSEGELTSEEYRSIKGRLVDRLSDQDSGSDSDTSSAQVVGEKENEASDPQTTEENLVGTETDSGDEDQPSSPK